MLNIVKPNLSSSLFKGRTAIFVSGFSMLMVQVVLLRELSSLYVVNELIVGVFLSFWMLFSGAGAFFARFFKGFRLSHSGLFPLFSGFAALLSLWSLYFARLWMAGDGLSAGISDWLLITAFATFVYCFPAGMMFAWFSAALSYQTSERQTERVYISEQWGSLVAGWLFYLVPVFWLNAFSAITLLVVLNVLVALFLFAPVLSPLKRGLAVLGLLVVVVLFFMPQYEAGRQMVSGDRNLTETFFSPHGSVDVWEDDGEQGVFMGGRFIADTTIVSGSAEHLNPALMLHPSPKRLLLINSSPGLVSEAMKYEGLYIDFVSSDQARISLEERLLSFNDADYGRVRFVKSDPHRFLKHGAENIYDVVLLGGGIPENLASTRFYTNDFFELIADNLRPDGLFVTGGIEYSSSLSDSRRQILMVLEETVSDVFPFLRIWAGEKVLFVASKEEITAGWFDFHTDLGRNNKFLNDEFIPIQILQSQIDDVEKIIDSNVRMNTRVSPVLFQLALRDLSGFWDVKLSWFALVLGVLFVGGLLLFRKSAGGVFLAGLVLGGMQVLLLLYWQLVMGNLFQATGLLFSFFMAGLAIGAWLGHRKVWFFSARYFPVLLIGMSVLAVLSVPFLDSLAGYWFFPVAVFSLVFSFAVLGGAIFVAGVSLHKGRFEQSAAFIYMGDVAGGAIGSFLMAIFLVPFAGLVNAGYLMGLTVLIAGLLMLKRF
ncbi:spermine/spermidine synthase domain-containing protein [Marinilabilia salmonicolor]|uniref:spermine/spermidine synthase domain-containing protein n=1 Tax=Marinilabilia salmonicolor TaxID=989 RepID=UPI00029A675A|nr:spermine synthase [Marinilabilia salmonicolor]